MKKYYFYILGILTGLANGIFGSGGGMIAVPFLEKAELEPQKSHATAIALTLPLSIISAFIYLKNENINISDAMMYIPGGLAGAILGGIFLKKIPNKILRRIFGVVLIVAGVRSFLR